jgi:protein-tyrosine-phosphatase
VTTAAVEAAFFEPGKLNPNVVEVMKEVGIDLSGKPTQGVFDLVKAGKRYNAVITVCDKEAAERCPVFPGMVKRIAWSFKDPSATISINISKHSSGKQAKSTTGYPPPKPIHHIKRYTLWKGTNK